MKKLLLAIIVVAGATLSMSSCCSKCTYGAITVDVCRNQFESDADYNNYISAMEAGGYNCN